MHSSWTQSQADSESHQEIDEAQKAKEFFDPNFTTFAGDFFTKNLSTWELLVGGWVLQCGLIIYRFRDR